MGEYNCYRQIEKFANGLKCLSFLYKKIVCQSLFWGGLHEKLYSADLL